jgi:hypothetical protein
MRYGCPSDRYAMVVHSGRTWLFGGSGIMAGAWGAPLKRCDVAARRFAAFT